MTAIEWTGKTWNPTTGCDRTSAGCDNCYALTMAKRLKGMGQAKYQNDGDPRTSGPGFRLTLHPDTLDLPLHWRQPTRVFVNSMSDLFHARVPVEFTARVWLTMARTPQHTYQVLTKRPDRMRRVIGEPIDGGQRLLETLHNEADATDLYTAPWPLPNAWLGTSVEHADTLHRVDDLRRTAAAIRFLSLEPLLGPLPNLDLTGIHWVIIGGESGRGHRPARVEWFEEIITACRRQNVAVFVKQLGADLGRALGAGSKGGDIQVWPQHLRIREFPTAPGASRAAA